ncbi:MAG: PLP-dependent aminotransferase family protein [Gemmataceae bacterium]
MPPAPLAFSGKSRRTTDSPISFYVQKAMDNPDMISLAAGLVDEPSLPCAEVAAAVVAIMADPATGRAALQYGATQGLLSLREKVLEIVCTADGVKPSSIGLSLDCVALTTGSQQLLYLLGEVLFDPGDIVITEAPSYFVYHSLLQSKGARVLTVKMDDGGMDMDALESLLLRLERGGELAKVKLVYTVDYFQNPTGLSLAADRRPRLVELAKRFSKHHRIIILEDAAYREVRFAGEDLPSVKSFDTRNEHVVYTSTFSKPLSPGLKTGYALLPRDLVEPMMHLKGSHDFGSTNLAQHIIDRIIATGAYRKHVLKLRDVYREKCGLMLRSLEREFRDWPEVTWTAPDGGLFIWMRFPDGFDTGPNGPMCEASVEAGVLCVPGEFSHVPDERGIVPRNELRLCFGVVEPHQIPEAMRRLREACRGLETCGGVEMREKCFT